MPEFLLEGQTPSKVRKMLFDGQIQRVLNNNVESALCVFGYIWVFSCNHQRKIERNATSGTADCVVSSSFLSLMCLFHSPRFGDCCHVASSSIMSRCDVGWLLTACPMTRIRVVLLSQHISILPPSSHPSPPLPLCVCLDRSSPSGSGRLLIISWTTQRWTPTRRHGPAGRLRRFYSVSYDFINFLAFSLEIKRSQNIEAGERESVSPSVESPNGHCNCEWDHVGWILCACPTKMRLKLELHHKHHGWGGNDSILHFLIGTLPIFESSDHDSRSLHQREAELLLLRVCHVCRVGQDRQVGQTGGSDRWVRGAALLSKNNKRLNKCWMDKSQPSLTATISGCHGHPNKYTQAYMYVCVYTLIRFLDSYYFLDYLLDYYYFLDYLLNYYY